MERTGMKKTNEYDRSDASNAKRHELHEFALPLHQPDTGCLFIERNDPRSSFLFFSSAVLPGRGSYPDGPPKVASRASALNYTLVVCER